MVILPFVPRLATGGLLPVALLPTDTSWAHTRRVSILGIAIPVAMVLPFAVLYGRGEEGKMKNRDIIKTSINIIEG